MAEIVLEVSPREKSGKEQAKKLRAAGRIPAIVYGGHAEPVAIAVDRKSVSEMVLKSEHGVRSIFLLKLSGSDQQRHAMIKDVQIDPISRKMTHIDFVRVTMDEVVRATIPPWTWQCVWEMNWASRWWSSLHQFRFIQEQISATCAS